MENKTMNRREFVKKSAMGAGAAAAGVMYMPERAFGANDRISLGLVGPGSRAQALIKWVYEVEKSHNAEFTAVCDIWNQRRDEAAVNFNQLANRDDRAGLADIQIVAFIEFCRSFIATAD